MSFKRHVLRFFDHPGGRRLLAAATTRYARWQTGVRDLDVLYEGLWMHRVGAHVFPDGRRYSYFRDELMRWPDQAARYRSEAREYWFHAGSPIPGEVVIDVGAGRGEDVLAFAETVGPKGRVLALEAHPLSNEILRRFCELNHLTNVIPIQVAAMDQSGEISIGDADDWTENTVGTGSLLVRAALLDDICDEHGIGSVGLLKVNIEGAERQALPGTVRTLARTRIVSVACHDFRADRGHGEHYRTRAFVEQFLSAQGFVVTSRAGDPRDWVRDHVFGVRPAASERSSQQEVPPHGDVLARQR